MATCGRRTRNTQGNAARVKRRAVSSNGLISARPSLVMGKLIPHTAVTRTASNRCLCFTGTGPFSVARREVMHQADFFVNGGGPPAIVGQQRLESGHA